MSRKCIEFKILTKTTGTMKIQLPILASKSLMSIEKGILAFETLELLEEIFLDNSELQNRKSQINALQSPSQAQALTCFSN